jgi:hypothetical protein
MSVRWDDIAKEWLAAHAPEASQASKQSLRTLLAGIRAAAHKEAVAEAAALDADVAEQLGILLSRRRTKA